MPRTCLSKLAPNQQATIRSISASNLSSIKKKLLDMGIIAGDYIKITKIAPLGSPINVTIKNYNLSLRKEEAEYIQVEY